MPVSLPGFHQTGTRRIAWLLAGGLAVLLFAGGPGDQTPRSLSDAWDLGHVVAFSVWSWLLLTSPALMRADVVRQWPAVLVFSVVAGGLTEGIQALSGGDVSMGDVLRDALGGVVALSWFAPAPDSLTRGRRRAVRAVSVCLLLVAGIPLLVSTSDEWLARARFPILSDFETPFEQSRWEGDARFLRDRSVARHGSASLRVEMDTSLYSGVRLAYFPRNWSRYSYLLMEILNPSPDQLELNLRVHDRHHERPRRTFRDRYNAVFLLRPGWNSIRIDLEDVKRAPAGRMMDMEHIRALGVFCSRLPARRTIFIDSVRLE